MNPYTYHAVHLSDKQMALKPLLERELDGDAVTIYSKNDTTGKTFGIYDVTLHGLAEVQSFEYNNPVLFWLVRFLHSGEPYGHWSYVRLDAVVDIV